MAISIRNSDFEEQDRGLTKVGKSRVFGLAISAKSVV